MANLRTIQFLRNANLYESLEAAKAALTTQAASAADGSPIAGRYTVGSETRTVLGIVANGTVSFFNNSKEIDNVLDGLDYSGITTSDAAVVTNVTEADGKIAATSANVGNLVLTDYTKGSDSGSVASSDSINAAVAKLENQIDAEKDARAAAINALDYILAKDDNKVVVSFEQTDGKISGTSENITSVKLGGLTSGSDAKIASTDTLGGALANIQAQIDAMDLTAVSGEGEVITAVAEADGKVSASKTAIKDVKLTGYVKDTTKTGAIAATDDVEDALSKIENQIGANTVTNEDGSITVTTTGATTDVAVNIKSGEKVIKLDGDGGGIYTDLDIIKITTGLPATVKERYQLLDSDNNPIGENIDIAKDSHIVSITYISDPSDEHYQNLEYVYIDASGDTQTSYVDISSVILEVEVENGIQAINHKLSIKLDTTGDDTGDGKFLTVGANGLKLDGVTDAISAAVESLDAVESGSTTHISVTVGEANGKLTAVTVTEDDIASDSDLTQEISDRQAGDTALSNRLGDGVSSANTATAQFTALSGDSNSVSSDTSVNGAKRYADAILANSVASLDADVSGNSTHVTVGVEEVDGKITAVTVAESDIANATDLAALSGKTFTEAGSANNSITVNTSTTTDGTVKLDVQTAANQISGLSAVTSVANEISGVSNTSTVAEGINNLYASLAAEIAARKAAITKASVSSTNAAIAVDNTQSSGTSLTLTLDGTTNGTGSEKTGSDNALTITDYGIFLSTIWDAGTFNDTTPEP